MDYVQYGGTPYLNNHNFGWDHHSNTSWDTSHNTLQSPQVQRSSLEEAMDELRRTQAESTMAQPEFSRSMAKMDYAQVRLPRFLVKNEKRQPPQEEMPNLEATMDELRKSQAQFMEEVHTPPQEESNFEREVYELAITMAKLAKCRVELLKGETRTNVQIQPIPLESLEKKKIPRVTSCTQLKMELQQPPMEKGMSIQELVAKHMNERKNMVEMSFEGQHESLSSLLEVIEEEDSSYNEVSTLRSKEKLEKITRGDDDVQDLKALVVMEDEPTSPKSHGTTKEEVLKAILEISPWGDMHEELKIEEVTPTSKVEEYIIQLNKKMEATIVTHKEKKPKKIRSWKIMCPRCYWSTTIGSVERMEKEVTFQSVVGRVKLD